MAGKHGSHKTSRAACGPRMMRWILPCIAVLLVLAAAVRAGSRLPSPNTNLEFWIAENVEGVDFSAYQEKHGLMGGRAYYGRGYAPLTGPNGEQLDPEHYVLYTVTSYPDYAGSRQHVTRIDITDPAVELYGVTLHSSAKEIDAAMKQHGFRQETQPNAVGQLYSKGKFSLRFADDAIHISVKVSNLLGIQF